MARTDRGCVMDVIEYLELKAQDATVQEEHIPLGTRPPQDISGANSL